MFLRRSAAIAASTTLAGLLAVGAAVTPAAADPDNTNPGAPPAGSNASGSNVVAGVGADADAELMNHVAALYNAQSPTPADILASYDAINPATGAAGENITTKTGCALARPNGANQGLKAFLLNQKSSVDSSVYCLDFARSSRARLTDGTENGLTFWKLARDAVDWVSVGTAYAPRTPLSTTQLASIFKCQVTNWAQVGGQYGAIHVYTPPTTAATYTFFLQAIGITAQDVQTGCGTTGQTAAQQNDGTSLNGDPQGIAPYAVSKWAAQSNAAPGIKDLRGGTVLGHFGTSASPTTTGSVGGKTYLVLNPTFANGPQGRLLYNVTRPDAPAAASSALFGPNGFICSNEDALLVPFGATPLGTDTSQSDFCGQQAS